MFAFKEKIQDIFFKRGVKAADYDFVGLTNGLCPLASELGIVWRRLAGGEECHKWSIQKLGLLVKIGDFRVLDYRTKNDKTSLKQRFKEVFRYFVLFYLDSLSGKREFNPIVLTI